jgi:hypothetical protein
MRKDASVSGNDNVF